MKQVFELTLRAKSGEERRTLIWFSTPAVRQDYYGKAAKRGIEVTSEKEII